MSTNFQKYLPKITLAVLLAATVLRVVIWLQQRSIFIDEANLVRNWLEKSYPDLWGHLEYEQYCPPVFSCLSKLIINSLGVSELSVRLLPLVSGIAMIWVFYLISKRFFSPLILLFSVAFVGFGFLFLRYSTECKQYATDGFVAMFLVFWALKNGEKNFGWRESLLWSVIGAAAIWTSMPAVFVLAGVGFYFFWKNFDDKKSWLPLVFAASFWLTNFGFYFLKILKPEVNSDYLQNWHHNFFLVFPPKNFAELAALGRQMQDIVSMSFGKTAVALVVALAGFSMGLRRFWKVERGVFFLFVVPILATFTASALHFYSMFGRLILFLIPLVMLLIFSGLDEIFRFEKRELGGDGFLLNDKKRFFQNDKNGKKYGKQISKIIAAALVLIVFSDFQQVKSFYKPFQTEWPEFATGLKFLKKNSQPGEAVFANFEVAPTIRFYTQHQKNAVKLPNLVLQNYECCDPDLKMQGLRAVRASGFNKIWVVLADPDFQILQKMLENEHAKIIQAFKFYRGEVVLCEFP